MVIGGSSEGLPLHLTACRHLAAYGNLVVIGGSGEGLPLHLTACRHFAARADVAVVELAHALHYSALADYAVLYSAAAGTMQME